MRTRSPVVAPPADAAPRAAGARPPGGKARGRRWRPGGSAPQIAESDTSVFEAVESRILFAGNTPVDIALIDQNLPDSTLLAQAAKSGDKVIFYNGRTDSAAAVLEKVVQWAQENHAQVRSISLLAHAAPGEFTLGNQWVDNSDLPSMTGAWEQLSRVLARGGSAPTINLYGCDLVGSQAGSGKAGQDLIDEIARITGAQVYASTHLVGAGGSWQLNAASNNTSAASLDSWQSSFNTRTLMSWQGDLLASPSGGETLVNTSTAGTQTLSPNNPRAIAADSAGDYVIVWSSQNGGAWGVFAQRYNAQGTAQGSQFQVNTITSGDQQYASVAMDAQGDFVVTWTSSGQSGSGAGVYAQRYNAAGLAQGGNFLVNTTLNDDQQYSTVAMDGNGNFVIVWQSDNQDGSGWGIYGQRFNAAGVAQGGEFQINTTTSGDQQFPDVAMDASGNFAVTWTSGGQDGSGNGVYAQMFDAAGAAVGGEFQVNTTTYSDQQNSTIAMSPSGNFVITWQSDEQDGIGWGVFAQRYSADGTAQGGEFQVNTTIAGDQVSPVASMDADGNFIIVWQSEGQDGDGWGVYGQQFDSGGSTVGAEFQVNTTTTGDQTDPSVAMDPSGRFVVAWDGNGAGDSSGIFMQRYVGPGITVTPTGGLTTTVTGGTATFNVSLDTAPTGNVDITFSSDNGNEGTVPATPLTFTSANWNTPQTVTVTGYNDGYVGPNTTYDIVASPAVSSDSNYSGLTAPAVQVTSDDTNVAGVTVTPASGLVTTTHAGSATFTVVLTSKPTGNVTIPISSSNTSQGIVSVSSMVFTPSNWNVPQTVTITGVNHSGFQGNQLYHITLGAAASSDPNYSGYTPSSVSVTNEELDYEQLVNTSTAGTQQTYTNQQTVAIDSRGDYVIVWASDNNTGNWGVYGQLYNYDGAQVGSQFQISSTTSNSQVYPSVAMNASGSFVVTWAMVNSGGTAWNVYAQQYNAAGVAQGANFQINSTSSSAQTQPAVAIDNSGNFVVTWQSEDSSNNWNIYAQIYDAGGNAQGSAFQVNSTTSNADQFPAIAVDGSGNFTITWSSNGGDGAGWGVMAQQYSASGATIGSEFVVNANQTSSDEEFSSIAEDPAGQFAIFWTDDTSTLGVYGQVFSAGATAVGSMIHANTYTPDDQVYPSVAMDSSGNFVVTWQSHGEDGSGWGIYGQRFYTNGSTNGSEFRINDTTSGDQISPSVAMDAGGDYVVAWSGNGVGDGSGVFEKDYEVGPAILVNPTSGLTTSVTGGTATFAVVLNTQPTANVVVPVSSSNTGQGTISTSSLTFTSSNWNIPQTVTVTGVDDYTPGSVAYTVNLGPATSSDSNYSGYTPDNVSLVNQDSVNYAGFTVTPTSGLTTTSNGGSATYTIVLTSKPSANVTVPISSSNTNEGTVSASSLLFTPSNWNTAQTVTVTGVNDHIAEGNVGYTIVNGPATSTDSNYSGMSVSSVSCTNDNLNVAGVTVTPTSGLTTTSAGGTATYSVVLTSKPTANVTISVGSSNTNEGTVSASSLLFTPSNWNTAQTVTVTGVNDYVAEGNVGYTIVNGPATSTDSNYSGMSVSSVSCTNDNLNVAGVTVTPTSGLTTTSSGGTATFTIVLTSKPTANVTVPINSSNTNEGTVSASSLLFTPSNWNTAQTVTITGVNDHIAEGNVGYTIVNGPATSTDSNYSGMSVSSVSCTNDNLNVAGVTVTPTSGLTTTSAGGTATYSVVLTSKPTANVTISVGSSNTNEGTVSASSLLFTPSNWNTAQTVTVTGVNDYVAEGNVGYTIVNGPATSTDSNYSGMSVSSVSCTNDNLNVAGVTVTPTSGLTTTSAGGTATYSVVLTSKPTANVTISVGSSNTNEGTVSASSLLFTPSNWNTAQTVTVTGANDHIAEGNVGYTIVNGPATSTDSNYSGMSVSSVSCTNDNLNVAGVTVTPTSGLTTTSAGGTATYSVVLTSKPTANVTISVGSSNTNEGTVSASSLLFTPSNWNTAQTVTVTGVNDYVAEGNVGYTIVNGPATSTDSNYSGMSVSSVSCTNDNLNTAGITVTPTSGLTTTSAGGTATYSVVLTSKPTANVTISVGSSNTNEGTLSASSLLFTPSNWNTAQTVTVTGANDHIAEGNVGYTIVNGPATSTDSNYSGMSVSSVSCTNDNLNVAGVTVTPTSGLTTTSSGGTATFTIVLTSKPTANVTVPINSSNTNEGTVSASSLLFTPSNWNTAQTVTVTGVNDHIAEGNVGYTIVNGSAVSTDSNYSGMSVSSVSCTNDNLNVAGVTVTPTSGLTTTSAGGTATFTIVLTSKPTANVTVPINSSNTNEGTVSASSLLFTPSNWNTAQTVTITGVNDHIAEGNVAYTIVTGAATSTDANYGGMNASDVSVTNHNTNTVGINVSPTSGLQTDQHGAEAQFQVLLNSKPLDDVTLTLDVSDPSQGELSTTTLTFTPSNWSTAQTVTATGLDDRANRGNVNYTVGIGPAGSSDPGYNALAAPSVSLTNLYVHDPLALAQDAGLNLDQSGTATITSGMLDISDADDTDSQIVYTITSVPAHGTLFDNGVAISSGGAFTQQDIDSGLISYTQDGTRYASDSFQFTVADDAGASLSSNTFSIAVNLYGGPPIVSNPIADQSVEKASLFSYQAAADVFIDPGNDTLTYSAALAGGDALPSWLSFDPTTRTFSGTPGAGTVGDYAVAYTADDGRGDLVTDDFAIDVTDSNPPTLGVSGTAQYTAGQPGRLITPNITVADSVDSTIVSATIAITGNYDPDQDVLAFTDADGIQGNWDARTGVLTLTGAASVADYQSALRSITYTDTADDPSQLSRDITLTVSDADAAGVAADVQVQVGGQIFGPRESIPLRQSISSNTPLTFSSLFGNSIAVADDNAGAVLDVSIEATHGALSLPGTLAGRSVNVTEFTGATLAFSGDVDSVNAALDGLRYTPTADYSGSATLQISVVEEDHPSRTSLQSVDVEISRQRQGVPPPFFLPPPQQFGGGGGSDDWDTSGSGGSEGDSVAPSNRAGAMLLMPHFHLGHFTSNGGGGGVASNDNSNSSNDSAQTGNKSSAQANNSTPAFAIAARGTAMGGGESGRYHDADLGGAILPGGALVAGPRQTTKIYSTALDNEVIANQLDALQKQLDSQVGGGNLITGAAATVSAVFTIGYVMWLVRGGSLLASLLATLPAWRWLDPLPVLENNQRREEDRRRRRAWGVHEISEKDIDKDLDFEFGAGDDERYLRNIIG